MPLPAQVVLVHIPAGFAVLLLFIEGSKSLKQPFSLSLSLVVR